MDDGFGGFGRYQPSGSSQGGPTPMCASVEPLLYGFRTQTLDRAQMVMVAQHVATCQHCSSLVQQLDAGLRTRHGPSQGRQSTNAPGRVASWESGPDAGGAFGPSGGVFPADERDAYLPSLRDERLATGAFGDTPQWPPMSARDSRLTGKKPLPEFLRPPLVYYTGGAALCGLMALTFILLSLPLLWTRGTSTGRATATHTVAASPTATAVPVPVFNLPIFSDWRAAYIAADGKVHVTALDGSGDITGPAMSVNASDTASAISTYQSGSVAVQAVTISPDGHTLAYINQPPQPAGAGIAPPTGPIEIVSLTGSASAQALDGQASDVFWSHDGSQLAFDGQVGNQPGIFIVDMASRHVILVPHTDNQYLPSKHVIGWIDSNHLAVQTFQGGYAFPPLPTPTATAALSPTPSGAATASPTGHTASPPIAALSAAHGDLLADRLSSESNAIITLNVQTGAAYLLMNSAYQSALWSLSPDGKTLLESWPPSVCAPDPCGSQDQGGAALIDTSTGQRQVLPNSTSLVPSTGTFVWNHDSLTVAQSIPDEPSQPGSWLINIIDLEQVSAITLRTNAFALGWSPDGRRIVVADSTTLGDGKAPAWAISAASPSSTPTRLAGQMTVFLGFVKTA